MRTIRAILALVIVTAFVLVLAGPAFAMCHIVSISASPNPVDESNTEITVTIHRVINPPGCVANIDYQTQDGTAKAPSDYTQTSGNCAVFDANPNTADCTFMVPIKDDTLYEGDEDFTVSFSGTSEFPVNGSTTVTIKDNDPKPSPSPSPSPSPTRSPSPKPSPTPSPSPSPTPPSPSPSVSPTPFPESTAEPPAVTGAAANTPSPDATALKKKKGNGPSTGLIIASIALVIAAGSGIGLWYLRRAPE